ncbi:MAG: phosphotransferase [Thermoplasmatota archaeon]
MTQLHVQNLAPYLFEKGLLSEQRVVRSGLEIQEISRRNGNFRAHYSDGDGVLVKQWRLGDSEGPSSLAYEAHFLRLARYHEAFRKLRGLAPELLHFQNGDRILVTELIHPATSLTKYHLNVGQIHFPEDAARTCGRIMGLFHDAGSQAIGSSDLASIRADLPLGLGYVDEQYLAGQAEHGPLFLKDYGSTDLFQACKEIRRTWHGRQESLVHGDLRWDNFLLTHGEGVDEDLLNMRLIDWELVSLGDPIWDIGFFLAEYVRFWSMAIVNSRRASDPATVRDSAVFPAEAMHSSAKLFWEEYCQTRALEGDELEEAYIRLKKYIASSLLFFAWEVVSNQAKNQKVSEIPKFAKILATLGQEFWSNDDDMMKEWFDL